MTTLKALILGILSLLMLSSAFALVFPKEVVFFDKLTSDEQIKNINNPEILFTKLGVSASTEINRARITVQAMPDCPENAPYQENVLQCFYINGFEFENNEVSSATIFFKVPKEWMKENRYNKIELRRYSYSWNENMHGKLSDWEPLTTRFSKSDDNFNYYIAYSDGLEYFSIVGKTEKINVPSITGFGTVEIPDEDFSQPIKTDIRNSVLFYFSIISVLSLFVFSFSPKFWPKRELSKFEELTDYIKNSYKREDEIRDELKQVGWESWQIDLGLKEAKK